MYTDYKELFLNNAVTLNASQQTDIKALYEVAQFTAEVRICDIQAFSRIRGMTGIFLFDF